LLGRCDDRQTGAVLARVADQRERLFAGHAPADNQRIVPGCSDEMRAHAGQVYREIELEMRMCMAERAADDA
jgi:hypothetical protein